MNSFVDKLLCNRRDDVSSGDEIADADAVNLSYIGEAVHSVLGKSHNRHHHRQWNVTSGEIVGRVHDTPRGLCDDAADPGAGHDDWFPDKLAEIIGRTESWCDVMSLGPPDGKFLTAFQSAIATLAERSRTSKEPIVVRMLFGNIAGMPVNCDGVIKALTSDLPVTGEDVKLQLWVGAWRKGFSWNHAKLIAVDGNYLHTGGHNLWDGHYLENNPVHDLSFELEGKVARDGHRFANEQWAFVESKQSTCVGCVIDSMPDYLPMAVRTRVTVSEWPEGKASVFPPQYHKKKQDSINASVNGEQRSGEVPLISIGRQGSMTYRNRPSDDAILAMINSSKTILRLVLQDMGPVCLPGTKKALPGLVWPKEYLAALGEAIYERGVDVEMILSNPNSIPGGLKGTEANYGNGWNCVDVAAEIVKSIQRLHSEVDDARLRAMVNDNLRICFVRHGKSPSYEDGKTIGMHSKHFVVDDKACYIGSQNLYVCDLAEWGIVVDHEEEVKKIVGDYFTPLWESSYTGEDVDVEAVMDGLEVDRDGDKVGGMAKFGGNAGKQKRDSLAMMPHGTGAEYYNIEKKGSVDTHETAEAASPERKSKGVDVDPADDTERHEGAILVPAFETPEGAAARDDVHSDVEEDSTVAGKETTASSVFTPDTTGYRDSPQPAFDMGLEEFGKSISAGIGAGLESLGLVAATPAAEKVVVETVEESDEEATEITQEATPASGLEELGKSISAGLGAGLESLGGTNISAGIGAGLESLGLVSPATTTADDEAAGKSIEGAATDAGEEGGEPTVVDDETASASSNKETPAPDGSSEGTKDAAVLDKDVVAASSSPSDEEDDNVPSAAVEEEGTPEETTTTKPPSPAEATFASSVVSSVSPEEKAVKEQQVREEEKAVAKKESMAFDCCGIADCLA